ncbi:MAG: prenyltransferase [Actinomycetota bacterium]|nr:prenyltransferase [Actinomycetota bacterium]
MLEPISRVPFGSVTRARLLPVLLAPFVTGAAFSYAQTGAFSWSWFAVAAAGAAAAHLSLNVLHDVVDVASGADAAARSDAASVAPGSVAIASGRVSRSRALVFASILAAFAAGCGVALATHRSAGILVYGAVAYVLAVAAITPPLRFASRIPGANEIAVITAGGFLQAGAAYAVATKQFDGGSLWSGLVPGGLLMLVFWHQALLHYRADVAIGRESTSSALGPERTVIVSSVCAAMIFVALIVQVAAGLFPRGAIIALAGALPLSNAYARAIKSRRDIQNYVTLLGATLGATALVTLILVISLVVRGAVR